MIPLIEALSELSFDVNSFLVPIEVSNEDKLLAFEEVPGKLVTLLTVTGISFLLFETYFKAKDKNKM